MRTSARFVTPSDFLVYTGINLEAELKDETSMVDSNKADRFLMRVEDRLLTWVDSNTWRRFRWEDLYGEQKEALQKAILLQALYVFRNSDISTDSGYDVQRGKIISKQDLKDIEICDASIDMLKSHGLYNHVMSNHRRYNRTFLKK